MSEITEKTKLPLTLVGTLIGIIVTVAFNAGVSHYRLQALESDWQAFKSTQSDHDRLDREHELKLQRLDISLANIDSRLERIDRKLDKIDAGKTR